MKTNYTAEELNLYSGSRSSVKAAEEISIALKKAVGEVIDGNLKRSEAWTQVVFPVLAKWAVTGSTQSEIRAHILDLYTNLVQKYASR